LREAKAAGADVAALRALQAAETNFARVAEVDQQMQATAKDWMRR